MRPVWRHVFLLVASCAVPPKYRSYFPLALRPVRRHVLLFGFTSFSLKRPARLPPRVCQVSAFPPVFSASFSASRVYRRFLLVRRHPMRPRDFPSTRARCWSSSSSPYARRSYHLSESLPRVLLRDSLAVRCVVTGDFSSSLHVIEGSAALRSPSLRLRPPLFQALLLFLRSDVRVLLLPSSSSQFFHLCSLPSRSSGANHLRLECAPYISDMDIGRTFWSPTLNSFRGPLTCTLRSSSWM